MNQVSLTGVGVVVMVSQVVLSTLGIETPEGSVANTVNAAVAIAGFVALVWGQLRRKDLHFGFIRKS